MEWAALITGVVGLGGIGGTVWGVHHQSKSSIEAEVRQRAFVAYSELLGAAQLVWNDVVLWTGYEQVGLEYSSSLERGSVQAQASAAAAACRLVSGGRLELPAIELLWAVMQGLVVIDGQGDIERGLINSN